MKKPAVAMFGSVSAKIHILSGELTEDERNLELSVNSMHRGELETMSMMYKLGWEKYKSDNPLIVPHKLTVGNSTVESKAPIKWEIDGDLLKLTLDENIYKNPEHFMYLSSLSSTMDAAFSSSYLTLEELGSVYVHDCKLWIYSVVANPKLYIVTDRKSTIFSCGSGQENATNNGIQVYQFVHRDKDTPYSNKVEFELSSVREKRLIKEWSEALSLTHGNIGHLITTAIKGSSK